MTWHVAVMLGLGIVLWAVYLWSTRPRATVFVFRCPFAARVSLLVDGELGASEVEELRGHLPTCMACRWLVEQEITFAALAARYALQRAEEDEGAASPSKRPGEAADA